MSSKKASTEYTCTVCIFRKVKCDKEKPCRNCIKAGITCEVAPPPPPRRRKRKLDERELVKKLAKYEELMKRHGVDYHSTDYSTESFEDADTEDALTPFEQDHRGQRTNNVSHQHHEEIETDANISSSNTLEVETVRADMQRAFDAVYDGSNSFPFALGPSTNVSLLDMHPPGMHILQLFQIYLDNVDPLLKLTHTPTLQKRVIDASSMISSGVSVDKESEALLFNIYFISVNSLPDAEASASFGAEKISLLARYHVASQQALLNANLMRTTSLAVLQAFILHLTSIRTFTDPRTHYVLVGIAVRVAIGMGIHRDGAQSHISSFDCEQRRRVWWNLVTLDKRIAEYSGSPVTAMNIPSADCKRPLNVNDSDLHLNARRPPQASNISTELVFCLARYELAATAGPDGVDTTPKLMGSGQASHYQPSELGETDDKLDHLRGGFDKYQKWIESTYLRNLDPSIPLHLFTILTTRQNIRKYQMLASGANIRTDNLTSSANLRAWALEESIRLLEDDNTLLSNPKLQGWLWYTHAYFPFPAYMFLVHELKRSCTGEMCSRAWEAMDRNHRLRGLTGPGKRVSPLHVAYGGHFLEAWDARVQAERDIGRSSKTSEVIELIREILERPQNTEAQLGEQTVQPSTHSTPTELMPQRIPAWQGPYGLSGIDGFDIFSSAGDGSGMQYSTLSLA